MLTRYGYAIDKGRLDNSTLVDVMRKELTVAPEMENPHPFAPAPKRFKIYGENTKKMYVPRYYAQMKGFPKPSTEELRKGVQPAPRMRFAGALKDATRQPEAAAACEKAFEEHGGGILSLPTGFGKTTVALYLACRLGLKTLIVTHKEFLADQWIERIGQFAPGTTVGRIQADVCDVEGKDFVVGMMQSLSMKDYDASVARGFGLLIIDEVHHVSAPVFSRCLLKFCCPYMLGLSATPHRKDGLFKVIEWCIGPLFFSIQRENQRQVTVQCATYRCERYKKPPPMIRGQTINLARIVNEMCDDASRNDMLLGRVRGFLGEGRTIIVLSDRRAHCEEIARRLGDGVAGLYIGGMSQEALKESESKRVIVATYGLANEGLDIPKLDTLVLSTPKSDVVQSVGRILRENHVGEKKPPLVLDIVDDHGVFYAQFGKRKRFYETAGFHVKRNLNEEDSVVNDEIAGEQPLFMDDP
jgi:superfamily II DNA or RNA helicase